MIFHFKKICYCKVFVITSDKLDTNYCQIRYWKYFVHMWIICHRRCIHVWSLFEGHKITCTETFVCSNHFLKKTSGNMTLRLANTCKLQSNWLLRNKMKIYLQWIFLTTYIHLKGNKLAYLANNYSSFSYMMWFIISGKHLRRCMFLCGVRMHQKTLKGI